jgi:CTP:molybdopterin cytidylyltransferase MocA
VTTLGLLLAAGAGTRMGRPKALVDDWLVRSVATLAPCDAVTVVLGAAADEARSLLDAYDVTIVVAHDWADGMGASFAAGLGHGLHTGHTRALVTLVDLPDVGPEVVRRLLAQADDPTVLARATYDGAPGHPVLIGRDHWAAVLDGTSGDTGARDYLAAHPHAEVECGDLATGADVDHPIPTGDQPLAE